MKPPISPGAPPAWALGEYPKSCRIVRGGVVVARLLCACQPGSLSKCSVRSAAVAEECAASAVTRHATHCVLRRHSFFALGFSGRFSELGGVRLLCKRRTEPFTTLRLRPRGPPAKRCALRETISIPRPPSRQSRARARYPQAWPAAACVPSRIF